MRIQRTVTVDRPLDRVFAYLVDFTTTTEWDPGTVETTLLSGTGEVGSTYRNVSKFMGKQTELVYAVIDLEPGRRFALRGENKTVIAHDTMTFSGDEQQSTVTYEARFDFQGVAKLVAPLLAPALKKLGDDAEKGLRTALERL